MAGMVEDSNSETALPPAAKAEGWPLIVGIGASAGGVLALRQFFSRVRPDCGMAFVVILHMSAQHESNLPALLQTQTNMPVRQVNTTVKVESNHIYVIPPNRYLVMADSHIRLTEPQVLRGSHTSIDLFFRTLADAYGKNAVAVLLSGTGTDGTLGVRRIKEEGGFVVAEDPAEAEYPEMPRSAIDRGLVDLVLPVGEMFDKICSLRDGGQRLELPADEEEAPTSKIDEVTLADILRFLRVRTGHDFTHYKRATLMRRIARRLQVHELAYLSDYLKLLQQNPAEAEVLFRDLLISVTNFFRDHETFDFLAREVIPRLFGGKGPGDQVRVWSAGCATGEEAYSLAMLLCEYAARLAHPPKLQVFATDIDGRAIAEGRECRYPPSITIDVSPERLQQFFVKDEAGYEIKKELRDIVLFAVHNALRDPPFSRLDLISCRNLLIYLNRDMQRRVLGVFHFALRPDGYLFLGASESAEMLPSLFSPVDKKLRIYSRRPVESQHPFATDWLPPRWQPKTPETTAAGVSVRSVGELHQEVIEYLAPPSVLINEQYDIEHISARAGRYLRFSGGEPTRNLVKVVHPDLRADLHAALLQAHAGSPDRAVKTRPLGFEVDGESCRVTIAVRVVTYRPDAARGFYLVIFDESGEEISSAKTAVSDADGIANVETIRRLEEELRNTEDKLRITVEQYETSMEELRASNEELQAINEELRSATEELETSKEELQSVNEELTTVNQEYREKIEEVGRANSDLQNLMASTDIGTIFLNRGLQIQLYTPSVQRVFNITSADIGRPLEHFTHKLDYDSLVGDAQQVLSTLRTLEREVSSSDGAWFLARLLPYRTLDDRIDGVVVTFVDITGRRQAEEQLREQAARLREQAEIVNLGDLMVRDADDQILLWSAGCELLYGYSSEEAVGKNCHELLKTEFPQPLEIINAELQKHGEWQGELVHTSSSGKRIIVASRWVLYQPEQNRTPVVLQINNDISDRRLAEEALRQADRNKDQFLATLAHELRNPLSAMLSSIELLRRPSKTAEETARARELLQRQIRHLLRLVDDLLDVERLAHGKITLQQKRVRLREIVETAMEICRPLIDPSSHQFRVSLPPGPLFLEVDSERIAQVVANLVHNAFKYTPAGGRIELSAQVEGSELAIRVADTGIGISADVLPTIFDMYIQGEKGPGTELKGLGVGLALVRQLVELHGGRVAAYSGGLQKGSEFVVHLPLPTPSSAPHKQPATGSARAAAPSQGRKILIVDDHRDAADALHALLESSGHEVATCYEGAAALESAKGFRPEVVVLDIGLPDVSGYEVARQLREILPEVTLIALSGWLPEGIEQARRAGFDHYLAKPVQFGELNRLLSNT